MAIRRDDSGDTPLFLADLIADGSAFTLTFWMNRRVDTSQYEGIAWIGGDRGSNPLSFVGFEIDDADVLNITARHSGGGHESDVIVSPQSVNQWRFVAVTYSGSGNISGVSSYSAVDGAGSLTSHGIIDVNVPGFTHNGNVMFGDLWEGEWFNGSVVGAKLWDAVLDSTEIAAERFSTNPVRTDDLIAAWPMRNISELGTDVSGNDNHLTGGTGWANDTDNPNDLNLDDTDPDPPEDTGIYRGDGTMLQPWLKRGGDLIRLGKPFFTPPTPPQTLWIPGYGGPGGGPEVGLTGEPLTTTFNSRVSHSSGNHVYENAKFNAGISVTGSASLTLRNCWIVDPGGFFVIDFEGSGLLTMEDCQVGQDTGGPSNTCVGGWGQHLIRRTLIMGAEDGIKTSGNSLYEQVHIIGARSSAGDPHADGLQASDGSNWVASYCNIEPGEGASVTVNSPVIIKPDFGPTNGIVIDHCRLNYGGWVIDVAPSPPRPDPDDITISNCLFGRDNGFGVFSSGSSGTITWTNNRWDDTLEVIEL